MAQVGVSSSRSLASLEPYLILAKTATGAAAAKLIFQATAAQDCFVFSELADTPAVKQLANTPEHASALALLNLFSFGTLKDYLNAPQSYPPLSQSHLTKLRQLTLVTLASQSRLLRYSDILDALKPNVYIATDGSLRHDGLGGTSLTADAAAASKGSVDAAATRILEDLIIESVYAGLLSGKFDQKRARFHVESVMGRDVNGQEELAQMEAQLREWNESTTALLGQLADRIAATKQDAQRLEQVRHQHDGALAESLRAVLKSQPPGDSGDRGGGGGGGWSASQWQDGMETDFLGEGGAKAGSKKKNKRTRT